MSHGDELKTLPAEGILQKPYLIELRDNGAIFQDGTEEFIDEILYCTGRKRYVNIFTANIIIVFRLQIFVSLSHSQMWNRSN